MNQPEPSDAATSRPAVESTGSPVVDEALDHLRQLDELDVTQHAAVFDHVHGVLREVLSTAGGQDTPA